MKNQISIISISALCWSLLAYPSFASEQINDLNSISKMSDQDGDDVQENPTEPADFDLAWKIYERMKGRKDELIFTRYAMVHISALAVDLPVSAKTDQIWQSLIVDAGISSEWSSVYVRGLHILLLNNREALGADHGSKKMAKMLLETVDKKVFSESFSRDKAIIDKSDASEKLDEEEALSIFEIMQSIADK